MGLLLLGAGCSSSPTPVKTPAVDTSIRTHESEIVAAARVDAKADLEDNDMVKDGLDVQYSDVTHDNKEDALVLIPSGGTAGIIAVLVYGIDDAKIHLLQRIDGYKMTARAQNGNLYITVYDPSDMTDLSKVSVLTYVWDGTKFTMTGSQDVNVQGE